MRYLLRPDTAATVIIEDLDKERRYVIEKKHVNVVTAWLDETRDCPECGKATP